MQIIKTASLLNMRECNTLSILMSRRLTLKRGSGETLHKSLALPECWRLQSDRSI